MIHQGSLTALHQRQVNAVRCRIKHLSTSIYSHLVGRHCACVEGSTISGSSAVFLLKSI